MKIGIFTFHCAQNYGAVLQAYGLQEYLISQGHDVYIIDYRPDYLIAPYKIFSFKKDGRIPGFYAFLREVLTAPIRLKRTLSFRKFVNKNLRLYKLDLNQKDNDFEAFIYGSDQIWNPKLTGGFDAVYFGRIPAAKDKLLISYAASVGDVSQLTDADKAYLKESLRNFSNISVRERELKDLLDREIGVASTCVCDPVLLAGRDVYDSISKQSKRFTQDYILLFQLEVINDFIRSFTRKVANTLNEDLIEVISRRESRDLAIRQSLSPENFVTYVKCSSHVITTSFHGTVFSLLYNKPFYTIKVNEYIDARAENLLTELGLESRLVDIGEECNWEMNFNDIQSRMDIYVKKSSKFLSSSLL